MARHLQTSGFAVDTYSYTLAFPVRECIQRLATQGFCEFELQMYPGHLWPAHFDKTARRELKEFLAANGLSVATLNMPNIDLNIAAATAEMRAMSLGILHRILELAGDLGVEGVVIGPGKANPLFPMPRSKLLDLFYAALDQLVPAAENHGTRIFVENMPFAFLPGIHEVLDALRGYGNDSIGIVYDVANGHFVKEDPSESLRACASRLQAIHLSDTDQSVYQHAAVGLGTVNFQPLPAVIAEIGFKRRPILEIIAPDPDAAIQDTVQRLSAIGFH